MHVDLIIVLTGERDSLINWFEQVGSQTEIPVVAGITQSLAPIAAPYQTAEQTSAVVAGFPSALSYEQLRLESKDSEPGLTNQKQMGAYVMAQWLVIILFSGGVIYYGIAGLVFSQNKWGVR